MVTDHYRALGVSRIASRDEVHKAFLRLSAPFRPDRTTEPGAGARFIGLSEAHDVLYDPVRRSAYDFEIWKSPS